MTSIRQTALLSRSCVLLYVLHSVLHIKAPFYRQVRREREEGEGESRPMLSSLRRKEEERGGERKYVTGCGGLQLGYPSQPLWLVKGKAIDRTLDFPSSLSPPVSIRAVIKDAKR